MSFTQQNRVPSKLLIYDVGMCRGGDTDFYLRKGFSVIGFEADPDLVRYCRKRFTAEIAQRRLTIVEGAIVDADILRAGQLTVAFYKNINPVWGTILETWAKRNENLGSPSVLIQTRPVNLAECLQEYGTPHYMKIDIEGADVFCLRNLKGVTGRPNYVSLESEKSDFNQLRAEFRLLEELGYRAFQAVKQGRRIRQTPPPLAREGRGAGHPGPSGLFGSELAGKWLSADEILLEYEKIFARYELNRDRIWYDTHARLEPAMMR